MPLEQGGPCPQLLAGKKLMTQSPRDKEGKWLPEASSGVQVGNHPSQNSSCEMGGGRKGSLKDDQGGGRRTPRWHWGFGFDGQDGQAEERGGWVWRGRPGCLADGSDSQWCLQKEMPRTAEKVDLEPAAMRAGTGGKWALGSWRLGGRRLEEWPELQKRNGCGVEMEGSQEPRTGI